MSAGCSARTLSISTAKSDQNISACSTRRSLNQAKACIHKKMLVTYFIILSTSIFVVKISKKKHLNMPYSRWPALICNLFTWPLVEKP